MNNAFQLSEEKEEVVEEHINEQVNNLSIILDALQNVEGSSYWKLLQQHLFGPELSKVKSQLEKEKEPIEMYRLQGEIKWAKRYDFPTLIEKYRTTLQALKRKL